MKDEQELVVWRARFSTPDICSRRIEELTAKLTEWQRVFDFIDPNEALDDCATKLARECARCRYADGCRERVVIDAALRLYHKGLAPSDSYREFRRDIQSSGLYETWRDQRSVRGSSGSRSLRVSGGCSGDGLCSVAAPCASCLERYPAL